jgi:hypothetical protein
MVVERLGCFSEYKILVFEARIFLGIKRIALYPRLLKFFLSRSFLVFSRYWNRINSVSGRHHENH